MKEIFVVGPDLKITPTKVPESEWEHPSGYFTAGIGGQPTIVFRDGWNKGITYGGFGTMEEAEKFKAVVKAQEAKNKRRRR